MAPKLPPVNLTIDGEVAIDLTHLGQGDIDLGLRMARDAALALADTDSSPPTPYDSLILRHLRAAETVAGIARKLELHVQFFDARYRSFLNEVARHGRIHEDDKP